MRKLVLGLRCLVIVAGGGEGDPRSRRFHQRGSEGGAGASADLAGPARGLLRPRPALVFSLCTTNLILKYL